MLWQCVCGVCVPIIKPWGLSIERWFRIHTPLAMRERGIKLLLKGRQNSWLCALEFVYFSAYDLNNAMYIWIYSYLQPVVHIYYNTCKGLVVLFISLYNESRTFDNFTLNQSDCYDCCSTYYATLLPRQRNFFFFPFWVKGLSCHTGGDTATMWTVHTWRTPGEVERFYQQGTTIVSFHRDVNHQRQWALIFHC